MVWSSDEELEEAECVFTVTRERLTLKEAVRMVSDVIVGNLQYYWNEFKYWVKYSAWWL